MSVGKGWRSVAFALAALLVAQPAAARRPHHPNRALAAQRGPHPAIWLIEDADTKIYLFGTFHILPRGFRWRTPRFDAIARSADELVIEVSDFDAPETASAAMAELELGKEASILWRVSPDRRQALQDMIDDLGVPVERFDTMQTWAVAMGLAAVQMVRGMSAAQAEEPSGGAGDEERPPAVAPVPEGDNASDEPSASFAQVAGVEGPLVAEFRASHRPVSGVETAAQQMRFFRVLTFAEQRALLDSIVDAYGSGNGIVGDGNMGQNQWARADLAAIARMTRGISGPLYDVLLRRRNAAWTDWLIRRLDRPGTTLFAVGAGHLAGAESVRTMLAGRGYRIRRVQ